MPQMGETVTEGTITRWLKAPGRPGRGGRAALRDLDRQGRLRDPVSRRRRPRRVLVPEGDTVPIGQLLARITTDGPHQTPRRRRARSPTAEDRRRRSRRRRRACEQSRRWHRRPHRRSRRSGGGASVTTFLSPVVRRLVDEHGLDPATSRAAGGTGRITRDDVLALRRGGAPGTGPARRAPGRLHGHPAGHGRNLVASLATAAHTLVAVEVDYARVDPVGRTGLTYLPFVARAVIDAVAEFPHLNAHVGDDGLDRAPTTSTSASPSTSTSRGWSCPWSATPTTCGCAALADADGRRRRAARDQAPRGRRPRRRHVHPHERRALRHGRDRADHQPAPGRRSSPPTA